MQVAGLGGYGQLGAAQQQAGVGGAAGAYGAQQQAGGYGAAGVPPAGGYGGRGAYGQGGGRGRGASNQVSGPRAPGTLRHPLRALLACTEQNGTARSWPFADCGGLPTCCLRAPLYAQGAYGGYNSRQAPPQGYVNMGYGQGQGGYGQGGYGQGGYGQKY